MICKCGGEDIVPKDFGDERFPTCQDCGYTFYDEDTLSLIREVKREQALCKRILGYIPGYEEAVKKGLI